MIIRRGFLSPPTALVLYVSSLRALKPPALYDVAVRRKKHIDDSKAAGLPPRGNVLSEDFSIPGPGGSLPLRLYRRAKGGTSDLIIYFHGGGCVLGSPDTNDPLARGLCLRSGARVLSVDYRLAPEHPFPAAAEDALAAYAWALGAAKERGWHKDRIFVSGDSSGGGLAAATCLMARDSGLSQPAGQILLYAVLDQSRTDRPSYERCSAGYILTKGDMDWFIRLSCPDAASRLDPRASPLLAADHSWLAPALIIGAQYDVLYDEGEAYAAALRAAGVPVIYKCMRGVVHGFASMGRFVPAADRAFRMAGRFIAAK